MSNILRLPARLAIVESDDPFTIPDRPPITNRRLTLVQSPSGDMMPVWTIPNDASGKISGSSFESGNLGKVPAKKD